jgi:hypothetical protein
VPTGRLPLAPQARTTVLHIASVLQLIEQMDSVSKCRLARGEQPAARWYEHLDAAAERLTILRNLFYN